MLNLPSILVASQTQVAKARDFWVGRSRPTIDLSLLRRSKLGPLGWTFLLAVVAPTVLYFLYTAIWESRGYVAEGRLTIRTSVEQRQVPSELAGLASKGSSNPKGSFQDTFIVYNYVKSEAILLDLGGRAYLERYFSLSKIDFFSRLKKDATIEDLLRYWTAHVSAYVDTVSGILTLKVNAYNPADASQIAQDIFQASEKLVNVISERNRRDAVGRADTEVTAAAERLASARDKLREFRNQNLIIDPGARANSIGELLSKLTLQKIQIENAMATFQGSLDASSPTVRLQASQLATIDQQIADLKKSLTDQKDNTAVSAQIAGYERMRLDEQFAEKLYTVAQTSFLRARQELEKQQLYLIVVVRPTMPEESSTPRVFASTLLLFTVLAVLWSILALVAASVSDHMV